MAEDTSDSKSESFDFGDCQDASPADDDFVESNDYSGEAAGLDLFYLQICSIFISKNTSFYLWLDFISKITSFYLCIFLSPELPHFISEAVISKKVEFYISRITSFYLRFFLSPELPNFISEAVISKKVEFYLQK